jgi:hypothetical protein
MPQQTLDIDHLQLTAAQTDALAQLIVGVTRELFTSAAPAPIEQEVIPAPRNTTTPRYLPPGHYIAEDGREEMVTFYAEADERRSNAFRLHAQQSAVAFERIEQQPAPPRHGLLQLAPDTFAVVVRDRQGVGYVLDHDLYLREVIEPAMPRAEYHSRNGYDYDTQSYRSRRSSYTDGYCTRVEYYSRNDYDYDTQSYGSRRSSYTDGYCTPSRQHEPLTGARCSLNEMAQRFAVLTYEQVINPQRYINWPATHFLRDSESSAARRNSPTGF